MAFFRHFGTYRDEAPDGPVDVHVDDGYEPGNDALLGRIEAHLADRLKAGKGEATKVFVGLREIFSFSF
jgi:hypothetical protein